MKNDCFFQFSLHETFLCSVMKLGNEPKQEIWYNDVLNV